MVRIRCGGQECGRVWCLLLSFFIFLGLSQTTWAEERYVLQNRYEEAGSSSITEVYLDKKTQRLVIKEFDTAPSAPKRERGVEYRRLAEAWNPSPQGYALRKVSEFDLKTDKGQEQASDFYRSIDSQTGAASHQEVLNRVRTGPSRFRLVQIGERENTQVGLYFNEQTGDFVFQSVSNQGSRKHEFPRTVGLASDLKNVGSDQTALDYRVIPGRTWNQFTSGKAQILQLMKDHGFQLPANAFDYQKGLMERFHGNLERIFFKERTSGVYEEVLYNPVTHELLFRQYSYDDEGAQNVVEEVFYDLNDDVGYQAAMLRFQGLGEQAIEAKNNLLMATGGCERPLSDSGALTNTADRNVEDINAVMESMWRTQLQGGLPDSLYLGRNGHNVFTMNFDLLGKTHALVGNVDSAGNLIDLNFSNPALARDKKMRIRHLRGSDGRKQFMVEAMNEITGEWESQLVLESEVGYNPSTNRAQPRIAAYLRGQQGEGQFDFDGFEKSVYGLNMRDGKVQSIEPRFRYDGTRPDPYSQVGFKREGSGGLINFAFHLFFSPRGKRDKVRDTILEKAREELRGSEFGGLIDDRDIERVANEVTQATQIRTNNFEHSKNRVEAVATEEAYSRYGDLILSRMMSTLLPEEETHLIDEMVDVVMRDLRLCLKRASDARNTDMASQCLDIFMKEAPVDVGKEILKLKLAQAGLGDFSNVAVQEFMSCAQEKYDPVKARTEGTESVSVIQACLYQALVITVDKVAPAMVDEKVGEISREMNLNLSYSRTRLNTVREKTRQCLREENIGVYGPSGYRFNSTVLGNLSADYFEQSFMKCANLLVEDVALSVGEVALNAKLTEIDLPDAAKARIVAESFEPGMKGCMEAQKATIEQITERYRLDKDRFLARNPSAQNNYKPGFEVPSFDPLECTRILTNLATGNATIETLKEMLGDKYEAVLQAEGKDPKACFESLNRDLLGNAGIWIVENTRLSKNQIKDEQKRRDEQVERRSAACLKDAIEMVSYYVAQDVIAEKLSENPKYANLQLSDEVKDLVGKSIRQCFKEKLATINGVDEILEKQEQLKDICGAEMLKDPAVAPGLFAPFVEGAISKVEMTEETKAKIIPKVIEALRSKLEGAQNIDQSMAIIDGFNDEAVPIVLEGILQEKIYGIMKPESDQAKSNADQLISLVQSEIFGADGQGELGKRLIAALDSTEPGVLDSVILDIETKAAQLLGPELLKTKAEQMLVDGVLETRADVNFVVEKGGEILLACLEKAKEEKREEPIDYCEAETTVKVTELILRNKLKEKLDNHPLIGKIFTAEEKKQIEDSLVNEERLAQLRAITAMEDGPAKEKKMEDFVLRFKVDATETIFGRAIPAIVEDKLPNPRYFGTEDKAVLDGIRQRIAQEGRQEFSKCLAPMKAGMERPDHEVTELDLDNCLNQVRLKATVDILPKRLEFILNYLHGDRARVQNLLAKAAGGFAVCAKTKDFKTNANEFGNHLDGCLMKTISDFVGEIMIDMRENEPKLLAGGDTRADWNLCREDLKRRAIAHVYPDGAPAALSNLGEAELYAELYRVGESKEPTRSPNIDWLEPNLIECAVEKLVPNATVEFRDAFLERHKDNLDPQTKDFILRLTGSVHNIFSTKREDGSAVIIDLDPLFGKASGQESAPIAAQDAPPTSKPTPILEMIMEYEPKVIEYLNMISAYDPEGMKAAIQEFEEETLAKLSSTTGEVPLNVAVDALLDSKLSNLLIESMVASMVKEQTLKALQEEGADTSVVWKLSSKEMIHKLFGSGEGLAAIENMKKNYLRPLMLGELDNFDIPKPVMNELTGVLVKDTGLNGFVETLFGAVIQKKLDDKRDWIESGWTAIFKMSIAGWSGYNKHQDFTWGDQWNTSRARYHLRLTPSGRAATERFANNMLAPMLRGELTDSKKKDEEEALEELVQKAMGENN